MRIVLAVLLLLLAVPGHAQEQNGGSEKGALFVIPIREDIMPPLTYLVRRGVKEAMDAHASVIILDMDTHGGRVDVTEEIISIIGKFNGTTVTYINDRAFSAGAFISVATQKIYMSPQGVIGAAAPIMISPIPGSGVDQMPDTLEVKTVSGIKALMRVQAEKNGHNPEVVEAMIDKSKELIIDDEVINPKGSLLTLTAQQAAKEYGDPPRPLLSAGTVGSLDELIRQLGYSPSEARVIEATGAEKIAFWINAISPLLLIIGVLGIYLEFKTPGFGLPGIVGLIAFSFYFFGGYIAGLSGIEWMVVFLLGLALLILELFIFPGTIVIGLSGASLMLLAVFMALADAYPRGPEGPWFPEISWQGAQKPLQAMGIAMFGTVLAAVLLSRWLPKTPMYRILVSTASSGSLTEEQIHQKHVGLLGQIGVTISALRPGGKAQFGNQIVDVISQGEMIPKGQQVRVVGQSGSESIVEMVSTGS